MNRFSMLGSALVALTFTTAAYAQNTPTPAPAQGPLVLERIHNGIVVAPDYKVTELNGEVAQLAGAYVGRVIDDQLMIGGAGYWQADGARRTDIRYGGVMVGWTTAPARIRFGARGLVGGGSATLAVSLDNRIVGGIPDPRLVAASIRSIRDIGARFGARVPPLIPVGAVPSFRVREDFFVFEPQVSAITKVSDHIAIDVAAGYRLIGMADAYGDRLDGATGSLGLQFGW